MGQIFNRIRRITKSYLKESNVDEKLIQDFLNDDADLKKSIDNLTSQNSGNNNKANEFDVNRMNLEIASKILGISANASVKDIKIAYKRKIREYHPDRVADMGKEIQNLAKIRTQQINVAYDFFRKERNFS